jgi:hypothetical protein
MSLIYKHTEEDTEFYLENNGKPFDLVDFSSFHWINIFNGNKKYSKLKKSIDKIPEGWSGPFKGYYLAKNATNKSYHTLIEAIEVAVTMNNCLGITMDRNGVYKLREMVGGSPIRSTKDDISWTKSIAFDSFNVSRLVDKKIELS